MNEKPLALYLISQSINVGHDTYDSAIVAETSPTEAKKWHPNGKHIKDWNQFDAYSWVKSTHSVNWKLIGHAKKGVKKGVILASFNAG